MTTDLRIYAPGECGPDGYPYAWHDGEPAIKDQIRTLAGDRCQRCAHPYVKGAGEWSPCDEHCTHQGPARFRPGWCELGEGMGNDAGDLDVWDASTATVPTCTAGELIRDAVDIEAQWRVLTVHHLNQVKADCRWWNLTALCQRCHLRVQRVVLLERVWPWEHTEWFREHAAGWYAHAYLGLDLTRDETRARLDELLSLERVA